MSEHRTPNELAKAFVRACQMLQELKAVGVPEPWVKLFYDASGEVHLGPVDKLEGISSQQVHDIVGSYRTVSWPEKTADEANQDYTIRFCEVLFQGKR